MKSNLGFYVLIYTPTSRKYTAQILFRSTSSFGNNSPSKFSGPFDKSTKVVIRSIAPFDPKSLHRWVETGMACSGNLRLQMPPYGIIQGIQIRRRWRPLWWLNGIQEWNGILVWHQCWMIFALWAGAESCWKVHWPNPQTRWALAFKHPQESPPGSMQHWLLPQVRQKPPRLDTVT